MLTCEVPRKSTVIEDSRSELGDLKETTPCRTAPGRKMGFPLLSLAVWRVI